MDDYWSIVDAIVERRRGAKATRYRFFKLLWDLIDDGRRLVVLRAPPGAGKTEAITAPFLLDLVRGERRWLSLIHVLPTRSLVNSMELRHAEAIEALNIEPVTVTHDYGELLTEKVYLDGDVVVTTYDTLLYRFYGMRVPGHHVLTPLSKVSLSMVVLDEVQLLQDEYWYALSLLPVHVASLLKFGPQVVIATATLPKALLNELSERSRKVKVNVDEVSSADERPSRCRVDVECRVDDPLPVDEPATLIKHLARCERCALLVLNTVKEAVAVYRALLDYDVERRLGLKPLLLHSRLRVGTRRSIETYLSRAEERWVLVATQVVEAGLDVDVDLLITELSPIDSLIQRLGRCGRRRRGLAIVYGLSPPAHHVYPESVVRCTYSVVKESPKDLEECLFDQGVAQDAIDRVYTEDVISSLRGAVSEAYDEVSRWVELSWIRGNPAQLSAHRPIKGLLRLGMEIPAYYTSRDDAYQDLLRGGEVEVEGDELKLSIIRLSVRDVDVHGSIPALQHSGGRYVALKITGGGGGRLKVKAEQLSNIEEAVKAVESGDILLLNPSYYYTLRLQSGIYELGVVDPWS